MTGCVCVCGEGGGKDRKRGGRKETKRQRRQKETDKTDRGGHNLNKTTTPMVAYRVDVR